MHQILLLVLGTMYLTPVVLFDQKVLPELMALKDVYGNIEAFAKH